MKAKKIVSMILALTLLLGIAGCGQKAKDSGKDKEMTQGKTETEATAEVTEIKFPTFLAGENVGAVFFLPQVERFNKKYEGKYKIVVEEVPQANYADKMKQLAQQRKLPVLVHAPSSGGIDTQWFHQVILENDMAHDLSNFAKNHPEVAKNWVSDSVEFCTINGKLICKPMAVLKPIGLYYNQSMYQGKIKEASVEEFIGQLGDHKLAFQTAENGWTSALLLAALIANEEGGLDLLNKNAADKLWDYNHPAFVAAVAKLQTLLQKNAASNSIGAAYADAANAFMSKNASIICNGTWMAGEFAEEAKDKWSNGFDGKDVKASIYPGNVAIANPRNYGEFWISTNATEKELEAAEAFLAFRDSQEEIEALLLQEGGNAPKLKYSEAFIEEQKKNTLLYEFAMSMDENTKYVVGLGDVFPASVADIEFGKLLPKLADNTLTAEQFCAELTKKAEEARQ